jgi:hypothetical protein
MATRVFKIVTRNDKVFFVLAKNREEIWDVTTKNDARPMYVDHHYPKPDEYAGKVIPIKDFRLPPCKCARLYHCANNAREIQYRCRCGQTIHTVPLTPEQKKCRKQDMWGNKKDNIHTLFHKMLHQFGDGKLGFKESGFDLMCALDKFVAKNKEIIDCGVDDDYHTSSNLYLIPHEDDYQLWGVTCLYVPQCTGEKPIRFFLYPGHLKGLIEGLQEMAKRCRLHGNRLLESGWTTPKERRWDDALPKFIKRKDIVVFKRDFDPPRAIKLPKMGACKKNRKTKQTRSIGS